jgi:hypothetical protein
MLRTLYHYLANDRTDGSGFMLDMGNLLWVATFYCLQARFLVSYPVILGPLGIAGVLGLKGLGYLIFRSANLQKDRFKADHPSVKGLSQFISSNIQISSLLKLSVDQSCWSTDGGERLDISIILGIG